MLSIGDTASTDSIGDCTDDEEVLFDERFADVVDHAETGDTISMILKMIFKL